MKRPLLLLGALVFLAVGWFTATVPQWIAIGQINAGIFELEFKDLQGNPVEGVQLVVTGDRKDGLVEELAKLPRSDAKGILTIEAHGERFGAECRRLFFIIPISDCSDKAPVINWHFVRQGKEVYKATYQELSRELEWPAHGHKLSLHKTIVINP